MTFFVIQRCGPLNGVAHRNKSGVSSLADHGNFRLIVTLPDQRFAEQKQCCD